MASVNQKKPSLFQGKVVDIIGGFSATPGPDFTSLVVQGQVQQNTAIVANLQAIEARLGASVTAKANLALAVATRKENSVADEAYVTSVVSALKNQLYGDQAELNAFGIGPSKQRTPVSPTKKVAATAKAEATRVARGTMSKKQRLAITAVPEPTVSVTGVAGAPAASAPTAETAPAASVSPAPAPTPAPAPAGTAGH